MNEKKYTLKEVIKILEDNISVIAKRYREAPDIDDYDFSSFIIGFIGSIKTLNAYIRRDLKDNESNTKNT